MSDATAWATVAALCVATIVVKAAGPIITGGRDMPPRALAVIALVPAALLSALVIVDALTDGGEIALGARTLGVAAAGVALWRGFGVVAVIAVAAVVTAGARAVGLP